jgi:carboxyl-terminal processing protease
VTAIRLETLDEFAFLKKRIDWLRTREEMKEISLNLETRRQMKAEEEAFRTEMKARQKELAALNFASREIVLESVAKEEKPAPTPSEDAPAADENSATPEFDVHMREALRVLRDAIAVTPNPADWTKNAAIVTALSHRAQQEAAQRN